MSKRWLIGLIAGAVVLVAALAVLTPTVIVGNGGGRETLVSVQMPRQGSTAPQAPMPGRTQPGMPQMRGLRNLPDCLRKQGLGQNGGSPPSLQQMRKALQACRPAMGSMPFGR